jgi:hypothetical protein
MDAINYGRRVIRSDADASIVERTADVLEGRRLVFDVTDFDRQSGRRREPILGIQRSILHRINIPITIRLEIIFK